ncbi:MAG: NADH:flavin oxidoreductase [Planctomycetes bacterium]|nr:NADH:flavin oxidoreductase [Planctomycetota bacterium]NUQ35594.1 NADH:flavin oxidoreductase [Planctomycetaceae bacterium]
MKLFEPITLNATRLSNRIVLPAMVTRLSGEDGHINKDITDRYLRYAKGEVGLIVVEAMAVHTAKSGPLLRLGSDDYLAEHRELAAKIHATSPSKVMPQIIHFLKISRNGWRQTVDMLSLEEIDAIVEAYGAAAARARAAGYDGVELHMAHAYTLSSFLSRRNPRKDDYGQTLENRLRLPLRVIEAVRKNVGKDFCVGLRFDGEECVKGGYTANEARVMALAFARAGIDYISVSAGGKFEDAVPKEGQPLYPYTGYSGDRCMPSAHYPDGFNRPISAEIKRYLVANSVTTPVLSAGKINTPELAEHILQTGEADLIGMARPLLADPDWPKKVKNGEWDKVIRCCYANVCKSLDENFRKVRCFLWPKGALQAPESSDREPPAWPKDGAALNADWKQGKIRLNWQSASDNEQVYGYDVYRREGYGGNFVRLTAVPGGLSTFFDEQAVSGCRYEYYVRAYDIAGNRSESSNVVAVSP